MEASPASGEVCLTRASRELKCFKSEHEGWMGNYGNTVDRWYHRAAVVMWPAERNFILRAKMEPRAPRRAVGTDQIKRGAVNDAAEQARSLQPPLELGRAERAKRDVLRHAAQGAERA